MSTTTDEVIAEQPIPHRPYSRIRGKRERSVTEIIGLKSIGGLPWAAAKETAMFAVLHQDQWSDLESDEAIDRLRTHHRGVWDGRASMGTAAHSVMESWISGETVDLYELVCTMASEDRMAKSWAGHEDQATEALVGYVDGLEHFWNDWRPEDVDSESVVRNPGLWIGQRDIVATMHGQRWLLDIKSTAEQDSKKAIYGDSWLLQLTGYDRSPEIVRYGWSDKGKLIETGTEPNCRADRCGIIHIRGDGNYTLFEVAPTDEAEEVFTSLARAAQWLNSLVEPKPVELMSA